jgi:hypothetical protein
MFHNSYVTFKGKKNSGIRPACYDSTNFALKGAHTCDSLFAPEYSYSQAVIKLDPNQFHYPVPDNVKSGVTLGKRKAVETAIASDKASKRRKYVDPRKEANRKGKDRGVKADMQITRTIDIFYNHFYGVDTHRLFFDRMARVEHGALLSTKDKQWLNSKHCLDEVRQLYRWMHANRLTPVDSQVVVDMLHLDLGFATPVDVVCVDQEGLIVLLEVKTGYAKSMTRHCGHFMRAPFQRYPDAALHMAFVQLLFGVVGFQSRFREHKMSKKHYVVQLVPEHCIAYQLPEDMLRPQTINEFIQALRRV